MDLVSRKELSNDASIESVDDWRVSISTLVDDWGLSMSTSVARDLVHDLVELVAIRRPTIQSANEEGYWIYANKPCHKNVLLSIIVGRKGNIQLNGAESFKKTVSAKLPVRDSMCATKSEGPPTALIERSILTHSAMYDDASLYYSFNPSSQPQQENSQLPKHKRKQSVLERPNVSLVFQLATDCFLMFYAGRHPG